MVSTREMVLYYQPEEEKGGKNTGKAAKLKSVLVRMGIKIRNVAPEQVLQKVGYLAGYEGFEETEGSDIPPIPEEILVMKNFTSARMDELLRELKRAGAPKISLKAAVTATNVNWTFYDLYQELKKEHAAMMEKTAGPPLL